MATATDHTPIEFTEFHLFAGIGGGSLGAASARTSWLGVPGTIRNIGAIDSDPLACEDYRKLTGSSITCMDLFDLDQYREFHGSEPPEGWREATAADVRAAAGGQCPDIVFTSPPCKGFSGLLPNKSAGSKKYQALNRLTVRSIRLILEAFADAPPRILLLENVPRIKSRGAELLAEIKELLTQHGYICHDADHDCGEIGGLGQRRRRYLLIARHARRCKPFVYQPPTRALKTIGDVIGPLPLPDAPDMGPMHRLPRLKWLTWLRLSLIPAGGDWRDLQKIAPEEYRLAYEPRGGGSWGVQDWERTGSTVTSSSSVKGSNAVAVGDPRLQMQSNNFAGSPGLYGVTSWDEPAPVVTGSASVSSSNTPAAIADPRVPESGNRHHSHCRVTGFGQTAGTVTGATHVANGAPCIADPRLSESKGTFPNRFGVRAWDGSAACITGDTDVQCGAQSIADPRLKDNENRHSNIFRVLRNEGTATCVTGSRFGSGAPALADVRLGHSPRPGVYRVLRMDETSGAVVGGQGVGVSNGPSAIADHRLGCTCRNGSYGVMSWDETASAVIGSVDCHAAKAAFADVRIPGNDERLDPPPVIISLDGTWHRPLTTMELLALQSFPLRFRDGSPVVLAGESDGPGGIAAHA